MTSDTRRASSEFFADGRVGYASEAGSRGDTGLGDAPVPPIAEINADPQFTAREIKAEAFEDLWIQHGRG